MKDNFDKYIIAGIIILFILYIANIADNDNKDKYRIEQKEYKICGKNIYVTDYTYNDELNVQALMNEIECICNNNC